VTVLRPVVPPASRSACSGNRCREEAFTSNRRLSLGVVLAILAGRLVLSPPASATRYSQWSERVNLGDPVNSAWDDTAPALSKDGLSLYFTSSRPCGEGDATTDLNIWVAQRAAADATWDEPECLEINREGYEDSAPAFSRDGHWMFFVSHRPGSLGTGPGFNGRDIWVSWRTHTQDDHAWEEPVNAGAVLNTAGADAGPTCFENEEYGYPQLFVTSNRFNNQFDIFVSDVLGPLAFGPPQRVEELATPLVEARPSIRHDGLELFLIRGATNAVMDIWATTRPDPSTPWSVPVNLGSPVNAPGNDQQPFIASDRQMLFFGSNREPRLGGLDIWVSTRVKAEGR